MSVVPSRSRSVAFVAADPDAGSDPPDAGDAGRGTLAAEPDDSRFWATAQEAAAIAIVKAIAARMEHRDSRPALRMVLLLMLDTDNPTFRYESLGLLIRRCSAATCWRNATRSRGLRCVRSTSRSFINLFAPQHFRR